MRYLKPIILLCLLVLSMLYLVETYTQSNKVILKEPAPKQELYLDEKKTIKLFQEASPSVAFITTKVNVRDYWSRNIYTVPKGTGSGFIWDEKGHVVTNFHVIQGASEASIRFNDGKSYKASLIGVSPEHDLAVLKIFSILDKKPALKIGTSNDLQVGQKVFAIGNPFGLDYTLTSGIISALNRTLDTEENFVIENLIQTDAAINPGNSGGPLLDSSGRLIGVNTAIYSPSGASAGVGFAVPVDIVNKVISSIIANGKYQRPSIGIVINDELNQMIQKQYDIQGVVILEVKNNSAAQIAGLRGSKLDRFNNIIVGDIITHIDNRQITSTSKFLNVLDEYKSGDTIKLHIIRKNEQYIVDVTLQ